MAKDNTWSQLKPSASPSVEMNDGLSNSRGEDAYQTRAISNAFPIRDVPSTHPHIPCHNLFGTTSPCNDDPIDAGSSTDIFQFSHLTKIIEPLDRDKNDYDVVQSRVDSVTLSPGPELRTADMYRIHSQANSLHANNMENRITPLHYPLSERNLVGVGVGINIAPPNSIANPLNTYDSEFESSQLGCSAYLQDSHVANKKRNIDLSLDMHRTKLNSRNDLMPQLAEDSMMCDGSKCTSFHCPNEGNAQNYKDGNETCGRVLSDSVEKLDGQSLTLGRGNSAMVPESAFSNISSTHRSDGNILSQVSACDQDGLKNILRSYPGTGGFVSLPVNTLYETPAVHSDTAISCNTTSRIRPNPSNILQPQLANNDSQYFIGRNSNLGPIGSQNVATASVNSRNTSFAGFPLLHETTHSQTIGSSSRQHQMIHLMSSLSQPFHETAQSGFDAVQRGSALTDFSLSTPLTQMNLQVENPGIFAVPIANPPGLPQWQETPLVYNQTIQHPPHQRQMTQFSLSQPFHHTAIDSAQRGPLLSDWRLPTAPTQMNPPLGNLGMFIGSTNNPQGYQAQLGALLQQNENAQRFHQQHQMTPFPSALSQHLHTTAERTIDEVQRDTMITNRRLLTASTPVNSLAGTPGTSTSPMDNQPGNCGQPPADHQVEPRANVSIPLSADKAETVKGHGHPQVSSMRRGGVRKRGRGQSFLAAAPSIRCPRTQPPPQPQPQIPRLQSPRIQSSLVPLSPPRLIQSYPNQESKSISRGGKVGQTSPSLLSSRKAALPRHQQSPIAYIKCKDKDEEHEPLGYKCFICKRDLSYPPEGPIIHPENPVPSAVLPCGHVFHQHCLQQITPENNDKDPPCIPCALGED